jgi:hypothetical protein
MAKTIPQLTALGAVPDDTDNLVIDDAGVTKKVTAANLKGDCLRVLSDVITVPDEADFAFDATTGSKLGTATTQKLAFWDATPVVQPAGAGQAAAAAQTQDTLTDSTGGAATTTLAAITAPAADATTSLTADMTAVRDALASLAAQLAKIKTDVTNIKTLQDATRTALVNTGLIKGAA